MLPLEFFLDTCIFISRAVGKKMDGRANICDNIICKAQIFTGASVFIELDRVQSRRSKIYQDLINHVIAGKAIEEFPAWTLQKNDQSHIITLIACIDSNSSIQHKAMYIRQLNASIRQSIAHSKSLIKGSPTSAQADPYFIEQMKSKGIIRNDAEILLEYAVWCKGRVCNTFVTMDKDHILGNRQHIIDTILVKTSSTTERIDIMNAKDAELVINSQHSR